MLLIPIGKICVVFLVIAIVLGCSETEDVYYSDFKAALEDSVVGNARPLPDIFPRSSKEIYGRFEISSGRTWLRFKFERRDMKSALDRAEELTAAERQNVTLVSPPRAAWWPMDLNTESLRPGAARSDFKLYKYYKTTEYADGHRGRESTYFVIDWGSSTGYYWNP